MKPPEQERHRREHSTALRRGGRPAPGTARAEFWTERTVAWYERANEESDYAARVLGALGPALDGCRDALDVGAGFGALALPLARRLEGVTTLEPSAAMAGALRAGAASAGLANVTVVEAKWGGAPVRSHDLVICAHVGGLLDGNSPFLGEAGRLARRLVAFVRDLPAAPDDDKFFYRELYPALLGRPYEHRCRADDTVAGLERLGIHPTVTPIEYSSDQPFDSLEEACDFWMTYMGLEGPEPRDYLRRYLAGRLVRRGGEWIAPFRKRAAVIAWQVR
jgi:SAM-dependent methyltransferase